MNKNQHGGNAEALADALGLPECPAIALDFSVNLNPLGPAPAIRRILWQSEGIAARYPDEYAADACRALAAAHGLLPEQVVVGNGSTEVFGWILQALRPAQVGVVEPCYAGYREVCDANGIPMTRVMTLSAEAQFRLAETPELPDGVELLFVGSPNNPTGVTVSCDVLLALATQNPHCTVVVDASFADFLSDPMTVSPPGDPLLENMIVVKSLTKCFCIPGLRLGMAWGGASLMDRIRQVRLPWSVNGLAQELALRLYADDAYLEQTRSQVPSLRASFATALSSLPGVTVFPSEANFLLVRLPREWPAARLCKALLKQGILIRSCANYEGLGEDYCRLAVRPLHEQQQLLTALSELLGGEHDTTTPGPTKRPAIMVVGTTSDAGKSIIAVGLCRLLARQGVRVAPFKAQNMALNSYVTREGGEMGRAQVTQAHAAGVTPHTDMNPVLLKPLGESGSQVIVNGQPIGNLKARAFYAAKAEMRRAAHEAYDRLAVQYEMIVLEGAGSPAEINLMEEDFVNMSMAAYAGARTVLVADIDRGGVFATIFGTLALIPPRYRALITGVIINKFRGDVSLLESGIRDIEAMTGVPVLGVLPYCRDLGIEEEDSLGLERPRGTGGTALDVAVIRLPRISNYTDFQSMEGDRGINIRYVERVVELGTPDLIILPGTKNTRADLQWLHDEGITDALHKANAAGTPLIGICGGYQMLGTSVADGEGAEGVAGTTAGIGLLAVTTRLTDQKELAQVQGVTEEHLPFCPVGTPFHGYEIHAGESVATGVGSCPFTVTQRRHANVREPAGDMSEDGTVFGCYVHGLFDSHVLRSHLWRWLCQRKGIQEDQVSVVEASQVAAFDRLADSMDQHLDLGPLFNGLIAPLGN
ncbi:MAG: cobyric acid synthase [Kiritimatiellae bacterium]|nr:cobyric acid synthase [Kiritimatiellia bacterium]